MATKKDKQQLNVWIDPTIAEKPSNFHGKYKKLFPKQGGYAKAVEMIIEEGEKAATDICEKVLENLKEKK